MRPNLVQQPQTSVSAQSAATSPASKARRRLAKYKSCFTWMLMGILLVGVALAALLTLLIREQSVSTRATLSTTIIPNTTTVASIQKSASYVCGNVSSYTLWRLFSTDGITMTVNTSMCLFNTTPAYFTSMAGSTIHWVLTGYGAVYFPTQNAFTIYARSVDFPNNTQLLALSQMHRWNVNWFGLLQ